jgi:hypothetical protein
VRVLFSILIIFALSLSAMAQQPRPLNSATQSRASATGTTVQQLVALTPPDGAEDGFFGESVAMAGDTIAVEAFNSGTREGKVYVYVEPSTGWQDATVTAELTVKGFKNFLAQPVAISPDGNTIVVDGIADGNFRYSYVYLYEKPKGGWTNMTQTAALYIPDVDNGFGAEIATDGNTVLVGATGCEGNGDFSPGAVFLYAEPAGGWTDMEQTGELVETDALGCDDFGSSLAINGNIAVVGRTGGGFTPPVAPGSVYVFTEPADGWSTIGQTAILTAETPYLFSNLGGAVSLSGSTILAPATLSPTQSGALIFTEPAGGWENATQTATLTNTTNGVTKIGMIGSALSGSTAALIAEYGNGNSRALTLYDEPATGWQNASVPSVTVGPSAETTGDAYGTYAVAMSGNIIVVGAEGATVNGNTSEGTVYVYQQN